MTAVCYTEHGNSSKLLLRNDYPRPIPLPDQLLVAVHFASLNPCDYKLRRMPPGILADFTVPKPKIPGDDIAGIVVAVGSAVDAGRFKIGDRVAALMPILGSKWGACAQFAAVKADFVARVPEGVTLERAAAFPLVALTAMQAFEKLRPPLNGKTILVQAGAGGVGSFAVQWAKRILKMQVTATSSARNTDWLYSMGVDKVVDYTKQQFDEELRDMDVVLDSMSYKYEERTFASPVLKQKGGHYLNILGSDFSLGANGAEVSNGIVTPLNWVNAKVRRLVHTNAQDYDIVTVNPHGAQLQSVLDQMVEGHIEAVIEQIFPLDQVAQAFDLLEEGHSRGKILVKIQHD